MKNKTQQSTDKMKKPTMIIVNGKEVPHWDDLTNYFPSIENVQEGIRKKVERAAEVLSEGQEFGARMNLAVVSFETVRGVTYTIEADYYWTVGMGARCTFVTERI